MGASPLYREVVSFFLMMLGQLVIGGGKDQILASDDKQKQIPGGLVAQDGENEVPKVLEENSAKCFFMISVLGSLQTPRPRPVCVPGPPPPSRIALASSGQACRWVACSLGDLLLPTHQARG